MKDDQDWFGRYWDLTPEERREFMNVAMDDPELRAEAEGIRSFESTLESATRITQEPLSDDALLFYAQRDDLNVQSPAVSRLLGVIEEAIRGNAEATRRLQILEDRLQHFDSNVARIPEELAGVQNQSLGLSEPVRPYRPQRSRSRDFGRAVGRQMAASVAMCVLVYAVLFAVSSFTTSEHVQGAYLASNDVAVELLLSHPRGDPEMDEGVAMVLEGANLLRQAQVSTLGLFRRYDPVALSSAERTFEEITTREIPTDMEPFVVYFKAKLHLAKGELGEAYDTLNSLSVDPGTVLKEPIERLREHVL